MKGGVCVLEVCVRINNRILEFQKPTKTMLRQENLPDESDREFGLIRASVPLFERQQRHWCPHIIAKLSPRFISFMSQETLIEILEQEHDWLPQPANRTHLKLYDREVLEFLVYVVRQCCRTQNLFSSITLQSS